MLSNSKYRIEKYNSQFPAYHHGCVLRDGLHLDATVRLCMMWVDVGVFVSCESRRAVQRHLRHWIDDSYVRLVVNVVSDAPRVSPGHIGIAERRCYIGLTE